MTDSAEDIHKGYISLWFLFAKIFHILSARASATYRENFGALKQLEHFEPDIAFNGFHFCVRISFP